MFAAGASIDDVAAASGLVRATVVSHLCDYITNHHPASIKTWVDNKTYAEIAGAIDKLGIGPLRPIFEFFGGQMDYDAIRMVACHMSSMKNQTTTRTASGSNDEHPF
jgi:uncharacterized protein YpbB